MCQIMVHYWLIGCYIVRFIGTISMGQTVDKLTSSPYNLSLSSFTRITVYLQKQILKVVEVKHFKLKGITNIITSFHKIINQSNTRFPIFLIYEQDIKEIPRERKKFQKAATINHAPGNKYIHSSSEVNSFKKLIVVIATTKLKTNIYMFSNFIL